MMIKIKTELLHATLRFLQIECDMHTLLNPSLYSGGVIPYESKVSEDKSHVYICMEAPKIDPSKCSLHYQKGSLTMSSLEYPFLNKSFQVGQNLNILNVTVNYSNNNIYIKIPKEEDSEFSI